MICSEAPPIAKSEARPARIAWLENCLGSNPEALRQLPNVRLTLYRVRIFEFEMNRGPSIDPLFFRYFIKATFGQRLCFGPRGSLKLTGDLECLYELRDNVHVASAVRPEARREDNCKTCFS